MSLDRGTAITRHTDNKDSRDEMVPLHAVVVEHLRTLADASVGTEPGADLVFWWPHHERTLWTDFYRLQLAAGIPTTCGKQEAPYRLKPKKPRKKPLPPPHQHTTSCGLYGFHDERRAFATCNAEKLSADALQSMMRHKSYQTTKRYINATKQLTRTADALYVPEALRTND